MSLARSHNATGGALFATSSEIGLGRGCRHSLSRLPPTPHTANLRSHAADILLSTGRAHPNTAAFIAIRLSRL